MGDAGLGGKQSSSERVGGIVWRVVSPGGQKKGVDGEVNLKGLVSGDD